MTYNFCKLFTAQWSWKNVRECLYLSMIASLLHTVIIIFTANLTYVTTGEPLPWISLEGVLGMGIIFVLISGVILTIYQTLKLVVMSVACYAVCKLCKKGDLEAKRLYNEMLTWRK